MCNDAMDRLQAMGVFVAVAELGGFAAAARKLKISPSAATRMVAALEEHLGALLLQRTTRSVTLTDAGARYLDRARRILLDVSEAEGAAQADRSAPSGRLVVSAPSVFGRLHVAPVMGNYLRKYPMVTAELGLADRLVNLVEEGVDAAVRIGRLEDSSLTSRHVGATRRVVVASPRYLARHKKIQTPDDLEGHELVQFTALRASPEWSFFDDTTELRYAFAPRYVTNSAEAAIAHVELGGGLAMVLAYQVVDAVRAGRLRVVLERFEPPALPIQVVYSSSRLLSAKIRAFVDLIVATCAWRFVDLSAEPSQRTK